MIPKQFSLFGEKHKVSVINKVDNEGSEGEFCPNKNTIKLLKSLPKERLEQRYYHEIVHCILEHIGESKLSNNEKFVDLFAKALHQIYTTSK